MLRRALLAALLLGAACRTPDEGEPRVAEADSGRGTVSGVDDPRAEARDTSTAGALVITNRDNSVSLGLADDRVWMQLSDSLRRVIREQVAAQPASRDTATGGGALGAFIERTVKKTVQGALDQRLSRSLDDIEDVRYENEEIRFTYRGTSLVKFENIKVNDNVPVLRSFPPDDARRWVDAVRRAKGLPPQ